MSFLGIELREQRLDASSAESPLLVPELSGARDLSFCGLPDEQLPLALEERRRFVWRQRLVRRR
jgi:hypothetical protein